MPANTRGQRNVARREAARQKRQTRQNAARREAEQLRRQATNETGRRTLVKSYSNYASKSTRSTARHSSSRMQSRWSTRKSSSKLRPYNVKKLIARLVVLLFHLKIDPASIARRDKMFSGINYDASRFGSKRPYKFPPPESAPKSFCGTGMRDVKPEVIKSAPLLLGAPPCPGTKETKPSWESLKAAAAGIVMRFCPATKYGVELFRPVCIDPKIQKYALEWAAKAQLGVARLKNKAPDDDFCRVDPIGQQKCAAGLGVPRILMPSLDNPDDFLNRVHRQFHIGFTSQKEKMSNLIPAQGEIRDSRANGAAKGMDRESGLVEVGKNKNGSPIYASPIIISKDNYIIDGHHRWAAAYKLGLQDKSIPVIRIDAPIQYLLMVGALEPTNKF